MISVKNLAEKNKNHHPLHNKIHQDKKIIKLQTAILMKQVEMKANK